MAVSPEQEVRVYVSQGQETDDRSDARRAGAGCRGRGAADGRASCSGRSRRERPGTRRGHRDLGRSAGGRRRSRSERRSTSSSATGRVTIIDVTGYTIDAATRELEDLSRSWSSPRRRTRRVTAAAPPVVDVAVPRAGRRADPLRRSRSPSARAPDPRRSDQRTRRRGWRAAPRTPASVNPTVSSQLPSSR